MNHLSKLQSEAVKQKPKELVEERDEIVRLITLCNDGNVNITEEKYSKVKNYLTQQRTEILEEIKKGIQWAIDNSTGDDYHEGLEEAKHITNLLNKKDETK